MEEVLQTAYSSIADELDGRLQLHWDTTQLRKDLAL
jgi:hypothetical protein